MLIVLQIAETEAKLKERENVYVRRSQEVDELNKVSKIK
jgi:hypothetical protein